MQFNMFEAGAVNTPPKKPVNPSVGYPSNGDLSHGKAPTQLGAYWVYQLSEEFTALLKQNGIEPSADNLHQLADFFGRYQKEMYKIRDLAEEASSGAHDVIWEMRDVKRDFDEKNRAVQKTFNQVKGKLENVELAVSQANSDLADAKTYLDKFEGYQSAIEKSNNQAIATLNENQTLAEDISQNLSDIEKKRAFVEKAQIHVDEVQKDIDLVNFSLTTKSEEVANALTRVNSSADLISEQFRAIQKYAASAKNAQKFAEDTKTYVAEAEKTIRSLKQDVDVSGEKALANIEESNRLLTDVRNSHDDVVKLKKSVEETNVQFAAGIEDLKKTAASVEYEKNIVLSKSAKIDESVAKLEATGKEFESSLRGVNAAKASVEQTLSAVKSTAAQVSRDKETVAADKTSVESISAKAIEASSRSIAEADKAYQSALNAKTTVESLKSSFDAGLQTLNGVAESLEKTKSAVESGVESVTAMSDVVKASKAAVDKAKGDVAEDKKVVEGHLATIKSYSESVRSDKKDVTDLKAKAEAAAAKAEEVSTKVADASKGITWSQVRDKPAIFPPERHSHGSQYVAVQGARGDLGGFEAVDVRENIVSLTISKTSPDTTFVDGQTGKLVLSFEPAGMNECCVKVVGVKAGGSTAMLEVNGARWSGGKAPAWGKPGKTIVLVANFIGGGVILNVFDNEE